MSTLSEEEFTELHHILNRDYGVTPGSCSTKYKRELPKKDCNPLVLKWLAGDDDLSVRRNVAKNTKCTADILIRLAEDQSVHVPVAVALNTHCPVATLALLAGGENSDVRIGVVRNENCSGDILARLGGDVEYIVRRGVAEHINCPVETLILLAKDVDEFIRRAVASNINCPGDILAHLAKDVDRYVRSDAADHINCPVEILILLAKDEGKCVREAVAKNKKCPPDSLVRLAGDLESSVREEVAKNYATPPAGRLLLWHRGHSVQLSAEEALNVRNSSHFQGAIRTAWLKHLEGVAMPVTERLSALTFGKSISRLNAVVITEMELKNSSEQASFLNKFCGEASFLTAFYEIFKPGDFHTIGDILTSFAVQHIAGSGTLMTLSKNIGKVIDLPESVVFLKKIGLTKQQKIEGLFADENFSGQHMKDVTLIHNDISRRLQKNDNGGEEMLAAFRLVSRTLCRKLEENEGISAGHDFLQEKAKIFENLNAADSTLGEHPIFTLAAESGELDVDFTFKEKSYTLIIPTDVGDFLAARSDLNNCLVAANYHTSQMNNNCLIALILDSSSKFVGALEYEINLADIFSLKLIQAEGDIRAYGRKNLNDIPRYKGILSVVEALLIDLIQVATTK